MRKDVRKGAVGTKRIAVGVNIPSPPFPQAEQACQHHLEILIVKTEGVGGWTDGSVDGSVCKMVALQA